MKVFQYALYLSFWIITLSSAETITFKNGDRINATSVEQTNDLLSITSDRFGIMLINKNELQSTPASPAKKPIPKTISKWSGQISASQTSRDLNTIQQRNNNLVEQKQKLKDTRIQLKLNYPLHPLTPLRFVSHSSKSAFDSKATLSLTPPYTPLQPLTTPLRFVSHSSKSAFDSKATLGRDDPPTFARDLALMATSHLLLVGTPPYTP